MQRAHITTILFSLLYLAAGVGALGYASYYIDAQGSELSRTLHTLAEDQAQEQKYNELERVVAQTKAERNAIRSYVFTENDTIALLADLEQLADNLGVTLETTNLEITQNEKTETEQLRLNWTVDGAQGAVRSFIATVETLPYHSSLSALTIQSRTNRETGMTTVTGTGELTIRVADYDRKN